MYISVCLRTGVLFACEWFKVEVVKMMLQRATAVNDIPEFHLVPSGATPLMQAAGNAVGGKGLLSHLLFLSLSKAKGLIHSL